jgi:hypothetical protein
MTDQDNPFEEAGRQRKAFQLISAIRDVGIWAKDLPPLDDDAWWKNIAGLAGVRVPSERTRGLVARLLPIGECPDELRGPRHDMTGADGRCRGCGYDPFRVMQEERERLEGRT